jgi:hypothetical protein
MDLLALSGVLANRLRTPLVRNIQQVSPLITTRMHPPTPVRDGHVATLQSPTSCSDHRLNPFRARTSAGTWPAQQTAAAAAFRTVVVAAETCTSDGPSEPRAPYHPRRTRRANVDHYEGGTEAKTGTEGKLTVAGQEVAACAAAAA